MSLKIINREPAVIHSNEVLAEVLKGNLIKNAFRHNFVAGSITIRASLSLLEIQNTGAPIPDADRMFDRFYNGDERDGWGLGLARRYESLGD